MRAPSLIHALVAHALEHPDRPAFTWLDGGEREGTTLTYGALHARAAAVAAAVTARGVARGERALLLYPPGLDFIVGFLGCMMAGVPPVPAYPPEPARLARTLPRLRAIVADARPAIVLSTSFVELLAKQALAEQALELCRLPWLATDVDLPGAEAPAVAPTPYELAFVQYTSGSTGDPKGVLISHRNLVANVGTIIRAAQASSASRVVSWLPQVHDMGLVTGLLTVMAVGGHGFYMSPLDFLARPMRWLEAISRHRATVSGGPNFAYDLCARRAAQARAPLDLSTWTCAFNGAERVRHDTVERFATVFAASGFRRTSMMPCYGLAEAVVGVSWTRAGAEPPFLEVDPERLQHDEVVPCSPGVAIASVGKPVDDEHRVIVVDPANGGRLRDGKVGEIRISGPSVAGGYWRRHEETAAVFEAMTSEGDGPCLRTGDLGFVHGGELYVTGRRKDLIIVRGANHYPTDIEATALAAHPAIRPGCAAAFAVQGDGDEVLVVAAELRPEMADLAAQAADAVRAAIHARHELTVHGLVLLRAGALPKTTSGKLQRRACRDAYLAGTLAAEAIAVVEAVAAPVADAPRGVLEELLAVTGVERERRLARALADAAGIADPAVSLTDAGLDSLRQVQLATWIAHEFGAEVPLTRLLGGASAAALAHELGPSLRAHRAASPVAPVAALSAVQAGIFADHVRWPGSVSVSAAVRLEGTFDALAMHEAAAALAARHPLLGSTFGAGGPSGIVGPSWETRALRGERELKAALAHEGARPFDLGREPPLRLCHHALGSGASVLQLTLHHLAYDAAATFHIADELFALYRGDALPPPVRHDAYLAWEAGYLASPRHARDRAYWHGRLGGVDLRLPLGPPGAGAGVMRQTGRGLPDGLPGALRAVASRHGTTLYVVLLAAYTSALARLLERDDVLLGTTVSLRDEPGLRGVIGPAMNFVALRCRLDGARGARAAIAPLRGVVAEALEHRAYPFARLVHELAGPEAPLPRLGLNANFNLYDTSALCAGSDAARLRAGATIELKGARATIIPMADAPVVRPYDLTCGVWSDGRAMSVHVRSRASVLDGDFGETLLDAFLSNVADLAG